MTFLNPLVLFALAAAAIPVLLHLLNLRKLHTVEFSTLTFLKELQQTKIRRLKIRQLLLLLIRTLLVILIVLAFARPALRGSLLGHIGSHAHSTAVFILDDSFSMEARDEYGDLFKQAKDATEHLVDVLSDGDEAFLIKLSDLPQATIDPATHDFNSLKTMVRESHISTIRRPLEDALRLSAKLLGGSKNANKEVYIISDMQRTLFPTNLQQRQNILGSFFDDRVKLFVVQLGTQTGANVAIDSVAVMTKILEQDKPFDVYASVRNFGSSALQNYVISVFLDGVHAAQRSVQVEPWGSASVVFTVIPKRTGFIKGDVELENDAIEEDNTRYFSVYVPERINVMLVSDNPSDAHFPLLALQTTQHNNGRSLLAVQQTTSPRLPFVDLNNTDVVVLAGVKAHSSGAVERIKSFVERGNGLILFPGSDFQPGDYNGALLPALGIPPVEQIINTGAQSYLSFQNVDLDHPLFSTVFETSTKNKRESQPLVESPVITKALKRQTGKQGLTIIALSNGSPFLSEYTLGRGKILFYSVALTQSWSDLSMKAIFVPMLYRSILYTSSREQAQSSYIVGEDVPLSLPPKQHVESGAHYSLLNPDGVQELIQLSSTQEGSHATELKTVNRSEGLTQKLLTIPGHYELRSSSSLLSLFAANVDWRDSDERTISSNELDEFWKRLGISPSAIRSIEHTDQLQSVVLQSRFGVELWKYCLAFALMLALLEMIVARDSKKETQALLGNAGR